MGLLLCGLSYCLPPKLANFVRKVFYISFLLFLIYVGLYIYTIKSVDFGVIDTKIKGHYVYMPMDIRNDSIFDVTIKKLRFFDNKNRVYDELNDEFPVTVEAGGVERVYLKYLAAKFSEAEITVNTLYKTLTFKVPM
ncbi:hypothetical protein NUSPORA_00061 [Nucleospora cyclopteri]